MNDDDLDTDVTQETDVFGEARFELGVDHRVSAVFDDERAAVEATDVR
jgi:hypothetical protein